MTHLVTGYAGEEHIQSKDQGSFNASFFGTGQYVMETGNQFEASITSNNNVRILDGDMLMKGRHIRIEPNSYEDVGITTGTAGTFRNDLIVMKYIKNESTGVEEAYIEYIQGTETEGTPIDPEYTDGDILGGDSLNQMPLYQVVMQGVVLYEVVPLFETIPTYKALADKYKQEFIDSCETHLDSLNILDTKEEIQANTQSNQLAGALAVKELTTKLRASEVISYSTGWTAHQTYEGCFYHDIALSGLLTSDSNNVKVSLRSATYPATEDEKTHATYIEGTECVTNGYARVIVNTEPSIDMTIQVEV